VLFHSLDYLFFLPLVLGAYWLLPLKFRGAVLAGASLLFYASWSPAWLLLLLGVVAMTWLGGIWMEQISGSDRGGLRTAVLLLFLPLGLFKYWNWVGESLEGILGVPLPRMSLGLPVGISFFTFQAVAYLVDVRRGEEAERDPVRFTSFLAFFPQLVAGPIVRASQLMPQLGRVSTLARGDVGEGLYRIGVGMVKKVVFADTLRLGVVGPVFQEPSAFTSPEVMVALYAYSLQVYFDFSGYTDIALGSARLFGIHLPENFRRPYGATSVTEFWRRWHITLSNWVRDYVYFGLGGARVDRPWKVYRNLMITLLVIGIWHGASWNFVMYGLLHGVAVSVNRWRRKGPGHIPSADLGGWSQVWRVVVTFHFVVLARILFRSPSLSLAGGVWLALWGGGWVWPRYSALCWILLVFGYCSQLVPQPVERRLRTAFVKGGPGMWALGLGAVAAACLGVGTGEAVAFVYYQF